MKFSDLFRDPFYRQSWKMLGLLIGVILAMSLTKGYIAIVVVVIGLWGALTKRPAYALICFTMMPFLTIVNPYIFHGQATMGLIGRVSMPVMTIAMVVASSSRPGKNALPILALFGYVATSIVSSINGYCPMISYMKLINFSIFVIGIYTGTKNLDRDPKSVMLLRSFFFAFSTFVIVGSLIVTVVNPYAAYFVSYSWTEWSLGVEAAMDEFTQHTAAGGDAGFLCGILNQSQCLGPASCCASLWLLCDMFFGEGKKMIGHIIVFSLCPVVMFLTKSRTALLGFLAGIAIISCYCVPRLKASNRVKQNVRSLVTGTLLLLLFGAIFIQLKSRGISRWLDKYAQDEDSAAVSVENMTATRVGKIEAGLQDFRQNPMWGMGFQVAYYHEKLKNSGKLIMTAPIEKSFLPTMVLGEAGVVGAIMFLVFLLVFYTKCSSRQYNSVLVLMSGFLFTNFGEGTFFSPGGLGGPQWLYTFVGAFSVDLYVKTKAKMSYFQGYHWPC